MEGSILKRNDGTWQGAVTVGYTEDGKQKRKTVYGKTKAEVRAAIDEIKQQLAAGTFSDTKTTVEEYLERWLSEKSTSLEGKHTISTPKTERGTRRVALSQDVLEVLQAHQEQQLNERLFMGDAWASNDYMYDAARTG